MRVHEVRGYDSMATLNFFFKHLKIETNILLDQFKSRPNFKIDIDEVAYTASVLSHYAQTSRASDSHLPPVASLYEILEQFVLPGFNPNEDLAIGASDPEILEIAGSQMLFLTGFFWDNFNHRHNIRWYHELGRGFYLKASEKTRDKDKRKILAQMGFHFRPWVVICSNLNRTFRDFYYLLEYNSPDSPAN